MGETGILIEGCLHYKRRSKIVAPCCNKIYPCRYCHDENEEHVIEKNSVVEIICTQCDTKQKVQDRCENCFEQFGKYSCLSCRLFDDVDKKQYHCDGCGLCRVGGREECFHCNTCNMCLPIKIRGRHKCVENMSRINCPVCLEDMHTSRIPCKIPCCGHMLHMTCYNDMLKNEVFSCPTCCRSLIDMSDKWKDLDTTIRQTPMPVECQFPVDILCRDCQGKSNIKFHVDGLKCQKCGSYNTCRITLS